MGVHETARKIAFRHYENKCAICGKQQKRLDVHHIDGDIYNNDETNLEILCSSCHHRIDKRVNNIFNNPNWRDNMRKSIIKNTHKWKRDEHGRFKNWHNDEIKPYVHAKGMLGKKHTEETKEKISKSVCASKNLNIKNKEGVCHNGIV
jgi:DNA-directed RNA polymerase subunit RPC12/RpoP